MNRNDDDLNSDNADLFDRAQLRNYLRFTVGSLRRRRRLFVSVWASVVALTVAALFALPKTYHVESKLLAQRNQVLAVRGDGPDSVAPTRGAAETVQRRDNLVALIKSTDLIEHYRAHRAPAQRLADAVSRLLHGADTEQEELDGMVELLQKRLVVWTSDGTVSITLDWPDAKMAARLVDAAQQNFIEMRYASEITALSESTAIIRSHAASLTGDIDDAVAAVEKLRAAKQGPTADGAGSAAPRAPVPRLAIRGVPGTSPELAQLKLSIDAKQRALDDLEGARRHRLSELQTRIIEQRSTYTENHPIMVDMEQTAAALSVPSIQVKALTQEIAALREELERKSAAAKTEAPSDGAGSGPAVGFASGGSTPPQLPGEILRLDSELREDRDPASVYARGQLRDAMDKYSALRAQVQAAQIDLETAQAAFKYRYSVLTPAQVPKRPAKPNMPLLLLASFVAAFFAAVLVAVVADVRSGRLVERWQIERLLDRPILGEMVLSPLPREDVE